MVCRSNNVENYTIHQLSGVSKMLGHSKITTTQIYAKVIEKKLSEDMQLLRERLKEKKTMQR